MIKNIGQFCLMCIRKILPYLSFIVIISGVMVFLMWGVYTIPVEKIRPNAVKSAEIINGMPEHVPFKIKVPGLFFDTWTDPRMLNMASFLGSGNVLKDSLLNPRVYYGVFIPYPKAQYNIFLPYINLNIAVKKYDLEGAKIEEYSRLWQGWMIFLKPLLMFFDLAKIRIINLFLQLVLLIMIIRLIFQKLGFTHCMAFVTAMLFLNPILSWQCLEFATDVNIMLLATLWVLLNKNPDDKYMFFVIGAVTIAFDWLTYPLITLGIPLIAVSAKF